MAILEAMACSTPVIITPECNFPEVELETAGYVIDRQTDKWIAKLSGLLKDQERMRLMGEKANQMIKRNYTWDMVVNKTEELYFQSGARLGAPLMRHKNGDTK